MRSGPQLMARAFIGRALVALAIAATPLAVVSPAQAQIFGLGGFSEKGKKGPYITAEVEDDDLARDYERIARDNVDGVMGAGSIDSGELYGTGLYMPETERALEEMIDSLRPHWPHELAPGPIDVKIIGAYQFSPLAHPDNVVVVPLGMLIKAESDDEVVWLMAHEFSHIALGHFARATRARDRDRTINSVVSLLGGGADLAATDFRFSSDGLQATGYDQDQAFALSNKLYRGAETLRLLSSLTNHYHGRDQEDQADVAGLDLAYSAGFADSGASNAINQLGNEDAERKNLLDSFGDGMAEFARIEGARLLGSAAQNTSSIGQASNNLLGNLWGNVKTIAFDKAVQLLSASHRPAEQRREGVLNYFERAYPDGELRNPRSEWIDQIGNSPEVLAGRQMLDAREEALRLLEEGLYAQAIAVIDPATKKQYGNSPLMLNTAAQIYFAAGQPAEAEKLYSAALLPENTPENPYIAQNLDGYGAHLKLLLGMGNIARANEVIEIGAKRMGDDHALLPYRIRIALLTKDNEALAAAANRCAEVGDENLQANCRLAYSGPEAEAAYELMTPLERAEFDNLRGMAQQKSQSGGFFQSLTDTVGSITGD